MAINLKIRTLSAIKPGWPQVTGNRGITGRLNNSELEQLISNVKSLGDVIVYNALMATADIIIEILARSQPRVPVDTGELRRSGLGVLEYKKIYEIAKGNDNGTISVNTPGISP